MAPSAWASQTLSFPRKRESRLGRFGALSRRSPAFAGMTGPYVSLPPNSPPSSPPAAPIAAPAPNVPAIEFAPVSLPTPGR